MPKIDYILSTMAGVTAVAEPAGTVQIELGDGDTVARIVVVDGAGNMSTVYAGYGAVVDMMAALGACAHNM